jgi:hypothetical protein
MSLEVLTGSLLLNTIQAVLVLLLLLAVYRIGRAVYFFAVEERPPRVTLEMTYLFLLVFGSAVYGTVSQPKMLIDTPPRTETLHGLSPLKESS